MVLKLDARFACVWRDPFSLQFGIDPARVVLREVTTAQERMIAALGSGVSRSGLDMIAESSGATAREAADLLRTLKLLLVPEEVEPAPARVSIVGRGQTTERIADILALAGVAVTVSASVTVESTDLGIVVDHYVLDPQSYGFWLRRDLPHLPIIFGDDSVQIGPVVEPGTTACLYCLEHYRRDADASWSAMASQLWGRRAASETPLVSAEVAAKVARLALIRLRGTPTPDNRSLNNRSLGRPGVARSFRLAVDSGELTRRDWMPHPDCGCVTIPGIASADRPESGSAADSDQPTTVAVSVSLA